MNRILQNIKDIKGDKVIWAVVLLLCIVSTLAIYSSSASLTLKGGYFTTYFFKQIGMIIGSFIVIYLMHLVPIGWYRRIAFPALILSAVLLIATLLWGKSVHGARRELFGIITADFAKIGLILYLAMTMEKEKFHTFKNFALKILLPSAVIFILIIIGSTSAALLLLMTVALILFISGTNTRHLLKSAAIAVVILGLYVTDGYTTKVFPRSDTAVERLRKFFSDEDAVKERNTQADYAQIAVATGGIVGKGPGNSTQRYILSQAYSDYIYAIIVEEYGLVGGGGLILLYLILLYRAIIISRSCTRFFSILTVLGLVLSIVCQAILNMCVAVGLLPVTGQPLPLVSLGGSSLLAFSISLGIVLSVSRATDERIKSEKLKMENE
ncbi:MAG: FtsW/RodA/SpoVE family cell cycle protein [Prevotellaceae bacterium]|jgi:cell division protein FtsW|nr:FtsW/RodA/SpoVE family cell cycle protein [Prevotellaceae bacterium]